MDPFRGLRIGAIAFLIVASPSLARAEEGLAARDFYLEGQVQTHLRLFQTAMTPGPTGTLVRNATRLPLVHYRALRASDLDTFVGKDTAQVEVTLWTGVELADRKSGARLQGDIQTASVTLRAPEGFRRAWLKLGRQIEAGGAARFSRYDGLSAGIEVIPQLTASFYGGFLALPRENGRPGYYHLGAAASSLVRDPEAFEPPDREDYWLLGGRLSWTKQQLRAALSFHEQRDRASIGRRNLGLDLSAPLSEYAYLGATLLLDLDSLRPSTARVFADFSLGTRVAATTEYTRAEPALLLSRQSVLSVFSLAGYDECGGRVTVRPADLLRLTASGYLQFYQDSLPGTRLDWGARFASSRLPHATTISATYGRVDAVELGYHTARVAMNHPLLGGLTATLQGFAYFYDKAIEGYKTSLSTSLSLSYPVAHNWELLWSSIASRSPYAELDASTQLRLTYQFDLTKQETNW